MEGQAYVAAGIAVAIAMATFRSSLMDTPGGRIGRVFILVSACLTQPPPGYLALCLRHSVR